MGPGSTEVHRGDDDSLVRQSRNQRHEPGGGPKKGSPPGFYASGGTDERGRERDEGAAGRAAQARAESLGGLCRHPALRARGLGFGPARVVRRVLPLVGHLLAGRRCRRDRRQGRGGQGGSPPDGADPDSERRARVAAAADDRRSGRTARSRRRRHHGPSEHPAPLGDARKPAGGLPRALAPGRDHDGLVRRRHAERHGVPGRRARRRRAARRLAARPGGDGAGERQRRLLQPSEEVQGLDLRVPRLVHVSRDQRHRLHGSPPPGDGRDRLRRARRRRAFDRPAPRRQARRVRDARPGAGGVPSDRRDLPRFRRAPAKPRTGSPQVPVPPARLDGRALQGGHRGASGRSARAGRGRRSAGRRVPRPRRRSRPAPAGLLLRRRRRAARAPHRGADADRRRPGRSLRHGRAPDHQHAELPDPGRSPRARSGSRP